MGLFTKKGMCSFCNKEQTKNKLIDGYICKKCLSGHTVILLRHSLKSLTVNELNKLIEENKKDLKLIEEFETTRNIGRYIKFNDNKKQFMITHGILKVYNFEDIIDFELLENGETVTKTKGGVRRAIVGGALLGGVGAVVGSVTAKKESFDIVNSLKIKITLNNTNYPTVYIPLIFSKTKTKSFAYKNAYNNAQEILSALSIICKENEKKYYISAEQKISSSDEILKFKKLLDDGIITEDEFNKKKKLILGI